MEENKEIQKEQFDEEEFLKKVEKAASKGSNKANIKQIIISSLPSIILIIVLAILIVPKISSLNKGLSYAFKVDSPVADHDMTLENFGIFGHTVADFQDAVLGDSENLRKLEVYSQELTDVAKITDTGLFNIGMFTKNQLITYYGTAVYTVDMSQMKASDITLDSENRVVTIKIPHAVLEQLNIPEDRIQFTDPEKGLLAFGDLKATPQQIMQVQSGARERMLTKLEQDNVAETADRFAKLSVWELYSPIIKKVSKNYTVQIDFR